MWGWLSAESGLFSIFTSHHLPPSHPPATDTHTATEPALKCGLREEKGVFPSFPKAVHEEMDTDGGWLWVSGTVSSLPESDRRLLYCFLVPFATHGPPQPCRHCIT